MAFGTVRVTLRPIRFATLVDPADRNALRQAIQINTFLWGGIYNPIVPVYQETPTNWSYLPLKPLAPAMIIDGYIRFFDPDMLVVCGTIDTSKIDSQGRMIVSAGEITSPIAEGACANLRKPGRAHSRRDLRGCTARGPRRALRDYAQARRYAPSGDHDGQLA
jgi:hypothetical protein